MVRIWDHPRVCGEKWALILLQGYGLGSPPRVRGKAHFHIHAPHSLGITPACAGKSESCVCLWYDCWDHPRVCGEKILVTFLAVKILGSPPRVRGKASSNPKRSKTMRITPACAGKSMILSLKRL